MSKVLLDMSMSLDGFVAGPNVGPQEPMGEGGEALHAWMADSGYDARVEGDDVGATVIGRRTFDIGQEPWGGTPWAGVPSFVVTHRPLPDLPAANGGVFYFGSLETSLERARQVANEKIVFVLGPDIGWQLLKAGLLDEVRLHLVPILLGGGTRLFDDEGARLLAAGKPVDAAVTHLRFRV